MAVAALVLYGVWFVLAFGVRTVVQVRRTGDTGFKGLGGRPGSLEWFAGLLFTVALVVGVAAPVAALAGLDSIGALDAAWITWLGVAVASIGVVATLDAQMSMGDSCRIGVDKNERTGLVTGGGFGLVPNPIFSAMLLTAVGLASMVPNVLASVGLAVLVVALELQVRGVEEPYLHTVHGETCAAPRLRVGRFIPRVGRP